MPLKTLGAGLLAMTISAAHVAVSADVKPMTIGVGLPPTSKLNPYESAAPSRIWLYAALYDPLTLIDSDGKLLPWLAVDWTQERPSSWLFHLRKDMHFSDGSPFGARDVVRTLTYLTGAGKVEAVAPIVDGVIALDALDPLTVRVQTRTPDPLLPRKLSQIRIARLSGDQPLTHDALINGAIGTGPYSVESWAPSKITFKSTNAWRRAPTQTLTALAMLEASSRKAALVSGQIDYAAAAFDFDDLAAGSAPNYVLYEDKMPAVVGIAFNTVKQGPLRDWRAREALSHAVRTSAIVEALFAGHTKVASQPARREFLGYNTDLQPVAYDIALAQRLLAEAGFPKGFKFTMALQSGGTIWDQVFQLVAADFAKIGVTMEIHMLPDPAYQEMIYKSGVKEDAFGIGFVSSVFDAADTLRQFGCDWPVAWYCDAAGDNLRTQAYGAVTLDLRAQADRALMARARENVLGLYLYESTSVSGYARRLSGFRTDFGFIRYELITAN